MIETGTCSEELQGLGVLKRIQLRASPLDPEAAEHDHDVVRPKAAQLAPLASGRVAPRPRAPTSWPPAAATSSGTQWPARYSGSSHSMQSTRGSSWPRAPRSSLAAGSEARAPAPQPHPPAPVPGPRAGCRPRSPCEIAGLEREHLRRRMHGRRSAGEPRRRPRRRPRRDPG